MSSASPSKHFQEQENQVKTLRETWTFSFSPAHFNGASRDRKRTAWMLGMVVQAGGVGSPWPAGQRLRQWGKPVCAVGEKAWRSRDLPKPFKKV